MDLKIFLFNTFYTIIIITFWLKNNQIVIPFISEFVA